MAAIVIRRNAKATEPAGLARLRARACGMVQRAMTYMAAAVMVCAAGAALLQLAVQILSFPAPIAVPGITVMAAASLNSLRRRLRTRAGNRYSPGIRAASAAKSARISPVNRPDKLVSGETIVSQRSNERDLHRSAGAGEGEDSSLIPAGLVFE